MSELQSLKKAELNEICQRLGIHALTKDTKKVLIEKVTEYISKNGDAGVEAVQAALDAEIDDTETLTEQVVAAIAEDDDDDEEDDDEEEEEEEDDEEKDDKDYVAGPPLDLKAWVVDPVIEFYEQSYDKVLEYTDSVGITTIDFNGELRESLSKAITLNYLEVAFELLLFIYTFVPLVAVKDNDSIHQIFKDNILCLAKCNFEIPDVSELFAYGPLATLLAWSLVSIAGPLIVSYYINFTRRLITFEDDTEFFARIYTFDPFTFALSKVLFFYFLSTPVHFDIIKDGGFLGFVQNNYYILTDYFAKFATELGVFPLIIGIANVFVAIYSQFEEY